MDLNLIWNLILEIKSLAFPICLLLATLGPIVVGLIFLLKWAKTSDDKKEWFKKNILRYVARLVGVVIIACVLWILLACILPIVFFMLVK